jgi:hypothetical protein
MRALSWVSLFVALLFLAATQLLVTTQNSAAIGMRPHSAPQQSLIKKVDERCQREQMGSRDTCKRRCNEDNIGSASRKESCQRDCDYDYRKAMCEICKWCK